MYSLLFVQLLRIEEELGADAVYAGTRPSPGTIVLEAL